MAKEYFFKNTPAQEFELGRRFDVSSEDTTSKYLVSNVQAVNAEIYAPEVNFYLRNTTESLAEKEKNIQLIYAVRAAEYNASRDIDLPVNIGKSVVIIANEAQDVLKEKLESLGFAVITNVPEKISRLTGEMGAFFVDVQKNGTISSLKTDHLIWFNAPTHLTHTRGVYDPQVQGGDAVVEKVAASAGKLFFKKFINYDSSICLLHKKRVDVCGNCSSYCSFNAIENDRDSKELHVSVINCTGCGKCVSACPSGALDFTKTSRSSFASLSSYYKNKIALVIPRRINLEHITVQLPERVLPLTVENEHFLDECHVLTLLQTSGSPVILYAEGISQTTKDIASFVNEIYQRKFHKTAVHICENEVALGKIFENFVPSAEYYYEFDERDLSKRAIVAKRLAYVVGQDDLGPMHPAEFLGYGNIAIDQAKCTLCLSCAEACCLKALTAHAQDNTLRFNPSLCTTCGYCAKTCPETDCLHVIHNKLSLRPDYFKQNVMAQDELIQCTECRKEFAPRKSVDKIAALMKPYFVNDPVKLKTLYCCPDCKAKIMIENQLGVGQ